jgi:hypothetical protein
VLGGEGKGVETRLVDCLTETGYRLGRNGDEERKRRKQLWIEAAFAPRPASSLDFLPLPVLPAL